MKKLFALLLVSCAACLPGCDIGGKSDSTTKYPMMTSEWTQILEAKDRKIFLNYQDILGSDQKRFWVKEEKEKEKGFYTLRHIKIDCIINKIQGLAVIEYNDKGEQISNMLWQENDAKWEYVIPETLGNNFRDAVCSGWHPEGKTAK